MHRYHGSGCRRSDSGVASARCARSEIKRWRVKVKVEVALWFVRKTNVVIKRSHLGEETSGLAFAWHAKVTCRSIHWCDHKQYHRFYG